MQKTSLVYWVRVQHRIEILQFIWLELDNDLDFLFVSWQLFDAMNGSSSAAIIGVVWICEAQ